MVDGEVVALGDEGIISETQILVETPGNLAALAPCQPVAET